MLVSSTRRAYRHTLSGLLEQVISGISAISLAVYAYNVS